MTVLVVGDVMNDVLVRPRAPVSVGSDTDSEIRSSPGGSGANQAAWLATLGVPVRFYGRVGAPDVERHEAALRRVGVEAHLAGDPLRSTGTIVVMVAPDGERTMFTDRAANRHLNRDDLAAALDGVTHLHVSAYALFDPEPRAFAGKLIGEAVRRHVPVSVDPSSESYLRSLGPAEFLRLTATAAIVLPNAAEALLLTGCGDVATAAASLTEHYPTVVVKLGSGGALLASPKSAPMHIPAPPAQVLDTTGAGDAFCAGFLAAHLQGEPNLEAVHAALATASRALEQLGARPPEE